MQTSDLSLPTLSFVGTDILLGGNPGYMARLKLAELLFPEVVSQGEGPKQQGCRPLFSSLGDLGLDRKHLSPCLRTPLFPLPCRYSMGYVMSSFLVVSTHIL